MTKIMQGKTCVLTGASSGIGKAAAVALGAMGARLLLVARNAERGQAVVNEIRASGGEAELLLADLSDQAAIRNLARVILEQCPRLDVLINNAGAVFASRTVTADGLEATFATNHLAYFLLTQLLLDRLKASAPARIVNVSSRAHWSAAGIPFDDLQAEHGYNSWRRYCESKLANILFTRELARRLGDSGVAVNALHPGVVATGFGQHAGTMMRLAFQLMRPFLLSPQRGAETVVYLATSPAVAGVTGKYFDKCAEAKISQAAQDDDQARRLWEVSMQLTQAGEPGA